MASCYPGNTLQDVETSNKNWQVMHVRTQDRVAASATTSTSCAIDISIMRNVRRALPISVEFPNNQYIVNANNCTLVYKYGYGGAPTTYTMTNGNETASRIVTELQAEFNSNLGANIITVSYDAYTEAFTFTGAAALAATFTIATTSTCHALLGLNSSNTYSILAVAGTITSDVPCELNGVPYVIVAIKELNGDTDSRSISCFMKVQLTSAPDTYIFNAFASSGQTFNPPLSGIGRLSINVYNPDGSEYDMRGGDWSFSLGFYTSTN